MPYTEQVTTFDCLYPYKCTITGMKFYSSLVEFFLLVSLHPSIDLASLYTSEIYLYILHGI